MKLAKWFSQRLYREQNRKRQSTGNPQEIEEMTEGEVEKKKAVCRRTWKTVTRVKCYGGQLSIQEIAKGQLSIQETAHTGNCRRFCTGETSRGREKGKPGKW